MYDKQYIYLCQNRYTHRVMIYKKDFKEKKRLKND